MPAHNMLRPRSCLLTSARRVQQNRCASCEKTNDRYMRQIKLHFTDANHLDTLLNDQQFTSDIEYLNPQRLDNHNIILTDPIKQHHAFDTEMVVLSSFARAIKRLIFTNSDEDIVFMNPIVGQQKGGLAHGKT